MNSDDTVRDELRRLAVQEIGSPVPDTDRIIHRAHGVRRRRAVTSVAVAACLAAVVGTGISVSRPGAHPLPGPATKGTPTPTAGAPSPSGPTVDDAVVAWVARDNQPGHPPSQALFVDAGPGATAERVRSVDNAVIELGGFLDAGRTVVWADGNGEPAPFAQSLTADGKPDGAPRALLGGRLIGSQAILAVPGGGIAMRVLPANNTGPEHLVFLADGETIRSDVPVDGGDFALLTADAAGVVAGFVQPGGGLVVRHIQWDGSVGEPIVTIDGCSSGSGSTNAVQPAQVLAVEQVVGPRKLALAVAPCDSTTVAGRAAAYVLVAALDSPAGAANPVRLGGWTGLVNSLWWDDAGTLHVHSFATIAATAPGLTGADPHSYGWSGTGETMTPDGLDDVVQRLSQGPGGQVLEARLLDSGPQLLFDLPVRVSVSVPDNGSRSIVTGSASQLVVQ